MQISGDAEEFKLNTSIKGVKLGKEAELEKYVTEAMHVVTGEKDASIHEVEIFVASIPLQKRKEEAISKSRNVKGN